MTKDRTHHYAFARGYYDALVHGVNRNPWRDHADPLPEISEIFRIDRLRALYSDGYEWGISDYCAEHHPEEVNR